MSAFPQQSTASCQMFPAVSIALGVVFCPADNVHAEDGGGRSSCCSAHRDETCALSVAHLRSPAHIHTVAGATRAPQLAADPHPGYSIPESLGTRAHTPTTASCPLLFAPLPSPSLYSPDCPGLLGGYWSESADWGFCSHSPVSEPFPPIFPGLPRDRVWRWTPLSRTSLFLFMPSKSPLASWLRLAGNYPGGPGVPARIPGRGVGEEVSTSPWSQSPAASLLARGRTVCLPAPSPFHSA